MNLNPIHWLEVIVSYLLVSFHKVMSLVFPAQSGTAWALSIVCLVILIRILLIPLFVKQIKSQRNLQLIQPQIKEIQKKYAGDRERMSQEMMALYKDTGTNPLASCLPILAQAPVFFALFTVLQGIAKQHPVGVMTKDLIQQAREAMVFGSPIYATFTHRDETPNPTATLILTSLLIILMTATTFLTQRQMIIKNSAPDNPMVKQQKIMLYVFPIIFAFSGINFPVGVLLYWFTTNLWTMGQQFYVIRNNPQPGTPAFDALEKRKATKKKNGAADEADSDTPQAPQTRNQPKRKPRKKR